MDELLIALTHKVRAMSAEQAERVTTPARLRRAVADGLLSRQRLPVRSIVPTSEHPVPLARPILRMEAGGEPDHDWNKVAYWLLARWSGPLRSTVIYTATGRAGRLMGGRIRPLRLSECSHDVGLSETWLRHYRHAEFVGEDAGEKGEGMVPDAIVGGQTALEMGGVYTARKLRDLADLALGKELAFELW